MTPRCGSTLLTEWLESARVFGLPAEYLNADLGSGADRWHLGSGIERWAAIVREFELPEYLRAVLRVTQSSNGVTGVKVDFGRALPVIACGGFAEIATEVKYIYLTRRDLLGQAISAHRAIITGSWSSRDPELAEPVFDLAAICGQLVSLTNQMAYWERYFALRGIQPLRLLYEEIVGDCEGTVRKVAEFLGVREAIAYGSVTTRVSQQRNAINDEWRALVLAAMQQV